MAKLIIPTRNRPSSLKDVLDYLELFYPGTRVIIADGSDDPSASKNSITVLGYSDISVDYRKFDSSLGFFDRILDVLRCESDELFIMGADDDFPVMDVLNRGAKFLDSHADYVTALGSSVKFTLRSKNELIARYDFARPLVADTSEKRALSFARWSFPTTYAVTRRTALIRRYEKLRKQFLTGFVDFSIGIHDCLLGKIKAIPDIGFFRTAHYNGAYLRPRNNLSFLERSDDVLQLKQTIESDLVKFSGLTEPEAQSVSEQMLKARILELCGRPRTKVQDFSASAYFDNPSIRTQYRLFEDLFCDKSEANTRFQKHLLFISASLQRSSESQDNANEERRTDRLHETVERLRANQTEAKVRCD